MPELPPPNRESSLPRVLSREEATADIRANIQSVVTYLKSRDAQMPSEFPLVVFDRAVGFIAYVSSPTRRNISNYIPPAIATDILIDVLGDEYGCDMSGGGIPEGNVSLTATRSEGHVFPSTRIPGLKFVREDRFSEGIEGPVRITWSVRGEKRSFLKAVRRIFKIS